MQGFTRQDDSPSETPLGEQGAAGTHHSGEEGKGSDARPPQVRPKLEPSITGSLSILALLGVVALLYYAASVFITLFSSILIAIALEPAVRFLARRGKLPRPLASMILVFLAIAVLYGVFYFAYASAQQLFSDLPTLAEQVRNAPLVQEITRKVQDVTETLQEAGRSIGPAASPSRAGGTQVVLRDGSSWIETVFRGIGSLTTLIFSLSFIPFLVYFILAEKEALTGRTIRLFPRREEQKVRHALEDIEEMMQIFLMGNAIVAAFLSAATLVIFWLVGLPYWVVLGILSGVASTIPYLGLLLALLPVVVVGLLTFKTGVPIVVIIAGVSALHVVAANLLIPKFVGGRTHLNAVTSTMSLMFFGWLWGGMGLLLAIPIVAVLKNVLENIDSTRRIGQWLGDAPPRLARTGKAG